MGLRAVVPLQESCKALAQSLRPQVYQQLATFVLELNELQ
jgi:hypothetical protein